jgi:hypothetical protein
MATIARRRGRSTSPLTFFRLLRLVAGPDGVAFDGMNCLAGRALEHDPEKWTGFSEKITLRQ